MSNSKFFEKIESESCGTIKCKSCEWMPEYPESHCIYGGMECEYISKHYNCTIEDGELIYEAKKPALINNGEDDGNIYFIVPYSNRETREVQNLKIGAKYDAIKRLWYVPMSDTTQDQIKKLLSIYFKKNPKKHDVVTVSFPKYYHSKTIEYPDPSIEPLLLKNDILRLFPKTVTKKTKNSDIWF